MKVSDIKIELVDSMGSDINVVNAARVSFAKEVKKFDLASDQRLLDYLAKHGHWSPFAHTAITLRCKVPIALARQLVKHQVGGSWNEESRRYISDEPEFWLPNELHDKPKSAKQGCDVAVNTYSAGYLRDMELHSEHALKLYMDMLRYGVAPEEARLVLPLNTMTNYMWTGSVMFFHRVWQQRSDSHAQGFAREFADKLKPILYEVYPHSTVALVRSV